MRRFERVGVSTQKRRPWNRFLFYFFALPAWHMALLFPHPREPVGVGMNLEGSNRMGHDSFLTFATLGVLILYGEESSRSTLIRRIYKTHSWHCKHFSYSIFDFMSFPLQILCIQQLGCHNPCLLWILTLPPLFYWTEVLCVYLDWLYAT